MRKEVRAMQMIQEFRKSTRSDESCGGNVGDTDCVEIGLVQL